MTKKSVADSNERQQRSFDRLYFRFLEPLPQDVLDRMERIVAAPTIAAGETVLDVGTGTGALIPLIRNHHPTRIIACDLEIGNISGALASGAPRRG